MKNNYEWLDGYLLGKPGAVSEYKAEWGWLRYLVGGKQFATICTPGGGAQTARRAHNGDFEV